MSLGKLQQSVLLTLVVVTATGGGGEGPRLRLETRRAQALVFSGGAGAGVACTATGAPTPQAAWLTADFAPLPLDSPRWRVLSNGTLHILPSARPTPGGPPPAVRCRATNVHGAVVSPPITLLPVWEEEGLRVEVGAVRAGGVAALRCVWPDGVAVPHAAPAVRWRRNGTPLLQTSPTANSQYVLAGERGEWLLLDSAGAGAGDRYSCQIDGAKPSPPALLQVTENMPSEMPRLALSEADIHVVAGTDFCLPCAAPDYPPPHYTWYRESGGGLQAASEAGAWPWRGGAALCLARARAAAAGVWRCRAAGARGDVTSRAHILVRAPLTVTLTPALTVASSGDSVRLECQTSDPEATVSWLHMGAPAVTSADVTALGGGVLLLRVTPRTRGLWQCEARRGFDIEQATAELRLAEAAPELRDTFTEQALRAGGRVSLRCVAAAAPPAGFSWRRDDMPLDSIPAAHRYLIGEERLGASETASTLNISAASAGDGGRYACRATNRLGRAEHSARLNIYGPPLVRSTPPQRVLAGDNVTLFCPYAGYPISEVTWQRGGSGAAVGGEGRVRAGGAALQLRPALAPDAGRYSCRAAAPGPGGAAATGDVTLIVLNPPKISPFMFSSDLSEGNSVRVICSVSSGDRPLSFSWLKDGATLSPSLQIEETSLDDFSLLKFGDLRERHSGGYTCRVTNPAASVDYTASLHVKVPPSWTREPVDTAVAAGAPLLVACSARGDPAPGAAWHRRACRAPAACEWRALAGNATLWAPRATPDLAGYYRCTADNGVGPPLMKHVNISVFEPAQIESSNEILNVTCVHAATAACALSCAARGDEPLAVTWARAPGQPLDLHSGRVVVSETRAGGALRSQLAVRAPAARDAGPYRCRAANAHGRSERLFLLFVEEPPAAPTQLRVAGRGARGVRLSWRGARSLTYSALLDRLRAPHPRPPDLRDLILDPPSQEISCESGRACAALSGLRPGTAYSVRVRAASRAGQSPLSAPLLFTTLEDAPSGTPLDVRVRDGDSGELHVSWSPPAQATWNGELLGHAVYWRERDARGGARDAGRAVRRGGGTSLVLRSLRPRTQYAVTVRAFNRAGAGPLSPAVIAFTSDGEAAAPESVRCAGVSARELRVRWAPDPAQSQYEILYAPAFPHDTVVWSEAEEESAGGWRARAAGAAGGAGEARLAGLRAGTAYRVWLRARGGPAALPALCATMPAAAGAVSEIRARAVSADAVRVWWRAPAASPPPTHYTLHARDLAYTGSEGEWVLRVAGGDEPVRAVAGLRARARLELWVRAHSPAGAGPPSARVVAAPQPPAPAEEAHVWSFPRVVVAAAGARVRLRCAADGSPPLRRRWAPLPARHAVTTDGHLDVLGVQLEWAGNYTCSVWNALGAHSVTHALRTRPAPSPPPAPAPPRLARAAPGELHLTWDAVKTMFPPLLGYTVEWKREAATSEEPLETREGGEAAAAADTRARAVRGLACGARYRVLLRALNACGASPPSRALLASTPGYEPIPPVASEFVWANSSALRLTLLAWDAPCAVSAWRLSLRPAAPAPPSSAVAWLELRAPDAQDDVVEMGELRAGSWYEVRVEARWAGGWVTARYRIATLTLSGERLGESERLPAEGRTAGGGEGGGGTAPALGAVLPAALAAALAALTAIFSLLAWRARRRGGRWRAARRPRDDLPPPPIRTLDYTLPSKCDISDVRVVSARLSPAGGAGGAGDSASDSSAGEPCAACQRAAAARTPQRSEAPSSLRARWRGPSPPPPPAPARPLFYST